MRSPEPLDVILFVIVALLSLSAWAYAASAFWRAVGFG